MNKSPYIEEIKMTAIKYCRLAVLSLTVIGLPLLASTVTSWEQVNGWNWYFVSTDGSTAEIYKVTSNGGSIISIPSTLKDANSRSYRIVSIGGSAFTSNNARSGFVNITIPNSITNIGAEAFCGCTNLTSITIPSSVKGIGDSAFSGCYRLTGVTLPNSVTSIGDRAFWRCNSLANAGGWVVFRNVVYYYTGLGGSVTIPSGITAIGGAAFSDCSGLTSITIPDSVTQIGPEAFSGCRSLPNVVIPDSVISLSTTAFDGCDKLWATWYRRLVSDPAADMVALTVTNVVVHHVTTSVQSSAVTPPVTTGIVNVIAEVGASGAIAVPSEWANQYSGFATKFGSDFTAAVTKPTGKRDGSGNAMYVWQDYVAGTDPTDLNDVFRASITFDGEGKPVISHTPELPAAEAAKRIYRTFGKVRLNDSDWTLVNGNAEGYNFFKVTVEMR